MAGKKRAVKKLDVLSETQVMRSNEIAAADNLINVLNDAFCSKDQFYYHTNILKGINDEGMPCEVVNEQKLKSIDAQRLSSAANALCKAVELKLKLTGHLDEDKRIDLKIKKEKLDMEKSKKEDNDGSENGILLLPEVMENG